MNWILTPEGIREYLASLTDEPYVLKHTAYSLKSFIKEVLQPRDPGLYSILYNSFKTFRPRPSKHVRLPTIDELKKSTG